MRNNVEECHLTSPHCLRAATTVQEMVAHAVAVEELVALVISMWKVFAAAMAARETVARRGCVGGGDCCARRLPARGLHGDCGCTCRRWARAPSVREIIVRSAAMR